MTRKDTKKKTFKEAINTITKKQFIAEIKKNKNELSKLTTEMSKLLENLENASLDIETKYDENLINPNGTQYKRKEWLENTKNLIEYIFDNLLDAESDFEDYLIRRENK